MSRIKSDAACPPGAGATGKEPEQRLLESCSPIECGRIEIDLDFRRLRCAGRLIRHKTGFGDQPLFLVSVEMDAMY